MDISFVSTDVSFLMENMKKRRVVFAYKKQDDTVRVAKGTLHQNFLPQQEKLYFEKEVIDALVNEKYQDIGFEGYQRENGLKLIEDDGVRYCFVKQGKSTHDASKYITYYDLDKDAFRSFRAENFLGVISLLYNTENEVEDVEEKSV